MHVANTGPAILFKAIKANRFRIVLVGLVISGSIGLIALASLKSDWQVFIPNIDFSFIKRDESSSSAKIRIQDKVILIWIPESAKGGWAGGFRKSFHGKSFLGSDDTSVDKKCISSTDHKLLENASAVVIHGKGFKKNSSALPQFRDSSQRWCFYLHESPVYSRYSLANWKDADNTGFNWTISYRQTANVYCPYFSLKRREIVNTSVIENNINKFVDTFPKREKDAFWYVSHCSTSSKREQIAKELQKYGHTVDIYGGCSHLKPERLISKMGEETLASQYKFYLSFENSLCDDYVTEKFMRGLEFSLKYGVIPIVYGSSNSAYLSIAPNGSFIFAEYFDTVRDLSEFLKSFSTNREEIRKYFDWHFHYEMDAMKIEESFNTLCKKLFVEDETGCRADSKGEQIIPCESPEHVISNMQKTHGDCRTPTLV